MRPYPQTGFGENRRAIVLGELCTRHDVYLVLSPPPSAMRFPSNRRADLLGCKRNGQLPADVKAGSPASGAPDALYRPLLSILRRRKYPPNILAEIKLYSELRKLVDVVSQKLEV